MFPDEMPMGQALQQYFAEYHFANGGYNERWFHIKLGAVFIPLPNIKARVAAVKIHDIHHVITGYRADWKGEVEIAGWELAGGCGPYWVAWLLNMGSFTIGLILYPRALVAAFQRGRRSRTTLYREGLPYAELLDHTVGELRRLVEG